MRIQLLHKTRKSAAAYLTKRGWRRVEDSLGDWVFSHAHITSHDNIIIHHFDRTWEIRAW